MNWRGGFFESALTRFQSFRIIRLLEFSMMSKRVFPALASKRSADMFKKPCVVIVLFAVFLAGCGEIVPRDNSSRILAMGDSLMAWHSGSRASISHEVEAILQEPVVDRSVSGARVFYNLPITGAMGMNIPQQYREGDWDWVILNGGGNDLWLGCGCSWCDRKINRMLAKDGRTGEIATLVSEIRATGARVIYVGYLRSPGVGSLVDHCKDEGNELERRLSQLARSDKGVHFLSLADLVPHGDRSYHDSDLIHPSPKATRAIAERITAIMEQ